MRDISFEAFFSENFMPIVRTLGVALGNGHEAEELAQEAFTRALRRWDEVKALDRPAAWVYVVAVREASRRQQRSPRRVHTDSSRDHMADPSVAVIAEGEFERAVASLPPRQRTAIVLRFHAGLPLLEIATAMGCSVGTVKATLHSALRRLKVEFTEVLDED